MEAQSIRVFVSYKWAVEDKTKIVDNLDVFCKQRGITLIRDKFKMEDGDSISQFMEALTKADHIITVFSQEYFESEYCMYELLKIYQRGNFRSRVHPVLADNIELSDIDTQKRYIKFWGDLVKTTDKKIEKLNRTDSIPLTKRLKIYKEISAEINTLMDFSGDMKITPLADLEQQNYAPLLDKIKPIDDEDGTESVLPQGKDDQVFVDEIKEEIVSILAEAEELRSMLIRKLRLSEQVSVEDLSNRVIAESESKLTQIIRNISVCVRDRLAKLERQQAYKKGKQLIDNAKELVTLLSLFGIPGEEVAQHNSSSLNITLPHEAPSSAEVVVSRLTHRIPQFEVSKSRPVVQGKHAKSYYDLEPGIKDSPVANYIEKEFWKMVFQNYSPESFDRQSSNYLQVR